MRTHICALLCLVVGTAHASFEMMLVAEDGAKPKIHRIDPISGASLGSFGTNFIPAGVRSVAVNQNIGRAYVLSDGLVSMFNYSTGEFQGSFTVSNYFGSIRYDAIRGVVSLGQGYGSGVRQVYNTFGVNGEQLYQSYDGHYLSSAPLATPDGWRYAYSFSNSPYTLSLSAYSPGNFYSPTTSSFGTAWDGVNGHRDAVILGNDLYGVQVSGSSAVLTRTYVNENYIGTTASVFTDTYIGTLGVALGHAGMMYVRNGNRISVFNTGIAATVNSFDLPFASTNLRGLATVVAPEPSAMIALGVGIAAIVSRRRTPR